MSALRDSDWTVQLAVSRKFKVAVELLILAGSNLGINSKELSA